MTDGPIWMIYISKAHVPESLWLDDLMTFWEIKNPTYQLRSQGTTQALFFRSVIRILKFQLLVLRAADYEGWICWAVMAYDCH